MAVRPELVVVEATGGLEAGAVAALTDAGVRAGDRERADRLAAARMRRYRQRRRETAEQATEITARRVRRLADWLEANSPAGVAWLRRHVPPEIASEVVDELLRRDQERAEGWCWGVPRGG